MDWFPNVRVEDIEAVRCGAPGDRFIRVVAFCPSPAAGRRTQAPMRPTNVCTPLFRNGRRTRRSFSTTVRAGHDVVSASLPQFSCRLNASFNVEAFLRDSWARKPVLFKNLLPHFVSPLSPDELAGLSCTEGVESRIIQGSGPNGRDAYHVGDGLYTLRLGPFTDLTFQEELSDDEPWTLLVHEVNRWVPAVANVLDAFSFIPNWRVDDVMVSYATRGGGVGPHVDNYDVFLLQTSGRRRWRVSSTPISEAEEQLVPDLDVRILDGAFEADQDIVLDPGDCLYVPPRCPHWGEALDSECMTFSIGFRAPAVGDLTINWVESMISARGAGHTFLQDSTRDLMDHMDDPGRISEKAIHSAYEVVLQTLQEKVGSKAEFAQWFCEQVSSPKRFRDVGDLETRVVAEFESRSPADVVLDALHGRGSADQLQFEIRQKEGSLFAFRDMGKEQASLFVDGQVVVPLCSIRTASFICALRHRKLRSVQALFMNADQCPSDLERTLLQLIARDKLYVADSDNARGIFDEY